MPEWYNWDFRQEQVMNKNDLRGFPKYLVVIDEPNFFGPPPHEHRYDKNGRCLCGKVLADIRPYPLSGGATPWTG